MSKQTDFAEHLGNIAEEDVAGLEKAQKSYGDSWKKRGGVGAFMMLARKWDRIEQRMQLEAVIPSTLEQVGQYDIFGHILADERSEGLIDDIRDLRRYLFLVEAEMRTRGAVSANSEHRDNR